MKTVKYVLSAPEKYASRKDKQRPHKYRSEFMRDRDRVMYSKAFRRLSGKTQIFVNGYDDHARNRLTHTLEVAQIARTISTQLKLDDALTEAISLAHDLGHTPFGHVGERSLNHIMNGCDYISDIQKDLQDNEKGFKHNLQSVRVAVDLEHSLYKNNGINLTNFTLFGLSNHSKSNWIKYDKNTGVKKKCENDTNGTCNLNLKPRACESNSLRSVGFYDRYFEDMKIFESEESGLCWSFEAYVARISDEIAQRHHDLEDGLIANIMKEDEIIYIIELFFSDFIKTKDEVRNFNSLKEKRGSDDFVSDMSRFIVDFFVGKLLYNSIIKLNQFITDHDINGKDDFVTIYPDININDIKNLISFDKEFSAAHDKFEDHLRNKILHSFDVQRMDGKATYIIRRLFKAYLTNPQQLPDDKIAYIYKIYSPNRAKHLFSKPETRAISHLRNDLEVKWHSASNNDFKKIVMRTICDYIAEMTDSFALKEYDQLYG